MNSSLIQTEFLIVGAGFFGATVAERLASAGRKVLVIDKRPHIGGNSYSEADSCTGIECHKYGSHIFHTSNEKVWAYLNRFAAFNAYRHTVWTTFQNRVFSMPINLSTINAYYGMNLRPFEVDAFIEKERAKENISCAANLEEKAISLIGRPLYEAFIKGYTIKQWEKDPKELPPDIITRLPVRHNYTNLYFIDKHEGIPLEGYAKLFERMLDHPNIEVRLNTDYFEIRNGAEGIPTLYTGPIDRFFNYQHGHLDWRTIDFEHNVHETPDYQGCTVMNYADAEIPFTRIHEFKHYHPERPYTGRTVTFTEFSRVAGKADDPYYPVNTPRNTRLLEQYQSETAGLNNIWFGGRLGAYRYFDMDDTVEAALKLAEQIIKE
jgi:UDP-galactopyranose mutase